MPKSKHAPVGVGLELLGLDIADGTHAAIPVILWSTPSGPRKEIRELDRQPREPTVGLGGQVCANDRAADGDCLTNDPMPLAGVD